MCELSANLDEQWQSWCIFRSHSVRITGSVSHVPRFSYSFRIYVLCRQSDSLEISQQLPFLIFNIFSLFHFSVIDTGHERRLYQERKLRQYLFNNSVRNHERKREITVCLCGQKTRNYGELRKRRITRHKTAAVAASGLECCPGNDDDPG